MKILFAASECHPFIKTGGLGDVAYSLPKALKKLGHDVRVILPKYRDIDEKYKKDFKYRTHFNVNISWKNKYCGIEELILDDIHYYFVDNMEYFDRPGAYGYNDDGERFTFFCEGVIRAMENIDFIPDVLHVNDWHTAIIPLLLRVKYSWINAYSKVSTILTIHNLKFQGSFGYDALHGLLGLGDSLMTDEGLEFFGGINFMKGGINYADYVTTVSPTYSHEIKYQYFGEHLDGLMRRIDYKLAGILNGIDNDLNNPKTDKYLSKQYDFKTIKNKAINKEKLQEELGLPKRDVPLIGMVSRLTEQKGLDIITYALNDLMKRDVQIIIQGTGDKKYEDSLRYFHEVYQDKFKGEIRFDQTLAQRIYGSCDMFLMPSRFEPCGLSQMISMRYGTVPIVRHTGGLVDSVEPYNKFENTGTGFAFNNFNANEMIDAIDKACEAYRDKKAWKGIIKRDMEKDFSWDVSAKQYEDIYFKAMSLRNVIPSR